MSGIQMALLGVDNFLAVFNNADNINLAIGATSGQGITLQATYSILADATCTKVGSPYIDTSLGPTAWGTPTGGTPGNNYETRLNVSSVSVSGSGGSYVRFAGVDVSGTGFTSWYALSSTRAIDALCTAGVSSITGTLYIRNTSSLVEINRAFSLVVDQTI
jgi:hypothetical protein